MTTNIRKALPPLVVAVAGSLVALLFYAVHPGTVVVLLVPLALGWWSLTRAQKLTATDPVSALRWFEWAQLLPYSAAAAASAVLIGVAVWLAPPEKPTGTAETPAPTPTTFDRYFPDTLKAFSGALAAFATAAFVKPMEDPDSWVADQVKAAFQAAFEAKLKGRPEADAVRGPTFRGLGWDAKGRVERARVVAAVLSLGKPVSAPPPTGSEGA